MSIEKQCVQSPHSSCFESRFIGAECYVSGSSVQSIVEPQMYSNSVNLYSDTEHGESLLLTFHVLVVHYIRFQVEDKKNCFTDTVTNPFCWKEDGKERSDAYSLNCWVIKTRSRRLTAPSPLGSGEVLPKLLAT